MRVELLGVVGVRAGEQEVSGAALGGRRARVLLAALALADGVVPADRLAAALWGDDLPSTWQPALRGAIRTLRTALAPLGGGDQVVIATAPGGYRLGAGLEVDVHSAQLAVRSAAQLLGGGDHRAALEVAEPVAAMSGAQLLPEEDGDWLAAHRARVDDVAAEAADIVATAASGLGEHRRAVAAARLAVTNHPLDERAHRTLIRSLDRAGDRAGAVRAYERCRALLAEELGIDPSAATVAVYLAALADQAAPSSARVPLATTSFLGRENELAQLDKAVSAPGLVTVVGRGGVGKSRLAAQVAHGVDAPGGRLWVSLGAVADDVLVAADVALELGVGVGADDAEAALAEHLAPLGRTVLVLDGCDVVVDGVASLVTTLVASCPALTVLVTSRVPLGLDEEVLVPVEPLAAPEGVDLDALRANAQVQLIIDRVRSGGGALDLDEQTAELVAALCRRCDGLPLALELAAAQLTAMPVGDLLDQLAEVDVGNDDRLRAIARGSYELLDPDEATVFRRLSVLDGSVGLQLVRSVVAGSDVAPVRVVRILRELTARGLVGVDRSGARWRYHQDDDVHRFARELLVADDDERATFDRLADALVAMLPDDPRLPPAPFAADVTAVLGSVRSLFTAATARRAGYDRSLELAFRLHRYWAATTVREGRLWLARLLAVDAPEDGSPSHWTRFATYALGYLSYWAGDTEAALRELQSAVAMFDGQPDPFVARAYIYVAGLLDDLDRPDEALDYVRRAMAAAEPFGTDLYVAAAMGIGSVLSERGDPDAARYAAAAVARCRDAGGSQEQLAALLPTAAMICWQVGAVDDARAYVAQARPMHAGTKRIARVVLLSTAGALAFGAGDLETAAAEGATADAEATELGVERELPLIRCQLARTHLARGDLSAATEVALAALDVAARLDFVFPRAICLETAALVLDARAAGGSADATSDDDLRRLVGAAAVIRTRGDRPAPAGLGDAVRALSDRLGAPAEPHIDSLAAIALARTLLSVAVTGGGVS